MEFLNKNKKYIYSSFIIIFVSLFCMYIENKYYFNTSSIYRNILYFLFILFIAINLFFDYKKIWSFIFEKRYSLGITIFIILVVFGINTSSVGEYDKVIQPAYSSSDYKPFWNKTRAIRSDEFLAGTPPILSQKTIGKFSSTSNAIMGTKGSVLLFPKAPTFNISILSSPNLLGFLFLDTNQAFSFYSLLPYFLAFFAVFELLLIITKENKIVSLITTLLLVFSPPIQWWNAQSYLAYGAICLVLLDKFLKSKKPSYLLLYSILIGVFASCFVALSYPAWQVPYGYMYLIMAICLFIDNKNSINLKKISYLLISIIVLLVIMLPAFMGSSETIKLLSHTVYPGARNSQGGVGSSLNLLFQYMSSIFFGYNETGNPCEVGQFISLYPIPILLGIYQLIKNYKTKIKDYWLLLMTVLALLLNLWNFIPIGFLAKISLMYMSTTDRAQLVVSILCIFIMARWISIYQTNKISNKRIIVGMVAGFLTILTSIYFTEKLLPGYLSSIKVAFTSILLFVSIVLLFLNNKKWNKVFLIIMASISLFIFITVNPLSKGISVMSDKPVAKEIRKIVKKDKNALWISANTSLYVANYTLSNGARVINSVNFYPNIKLWKKLDVNNKYNNIYNRYAHIIFAISKKETKFKLNQSDMFTVETNLNDICKINVKYIISADKNINKNNNDMSYLSKIYSKDNMYIYKLACK